MTPFYADPWLTVLAGDCRDVLRGLPDESVDCKQGRFGPNLVDRSRKTLLYGGLAEGPYRTGAPS